MTAKETVIPPPLRKDLIITRQLFEGRSYFVIKDPVSLQYFRLTAENYHLATLFDGKRNIEEIRDEHLRQFPHLRLETSAEEMEERIQRFGNDLAMLKFLQIRGTRLKEVYKATRARQKKTGWAPIVTKLFFSRFSLLDPDEIFGRMARPVWWIWTRATLWVSIGLLLAAVAVFAMNYERIVPSMREFFSLGNLLMVWVLIIVIKSIHELGHGLTCKHFGGEVHEVGVMLLVFTPYFFVNVTDSWVMPKRRHRILISSAGIYVELIVAALATLVWAIVQPGQLQQMLFNIMLIGSVSTVLFNANPLMRFDGYYILTDLLAVPNLSTKSRAFISQQVKRLLFGRDYQDPAMARMPLPTQRRGLFYFYAIASYLYGYFIIYSITLYLPEKLAPYGLEQVGTYLAVTALFTWVVVPFVSFFKGLQLTGGDWLPGGRMQRVSVVGGALLAGLLVLCVLPVPLKIKRSLAVELADPEMVRPDIPGFVEAILVHEGDRVPAGASLARLVNRRVEAEFAAAGNRAASADLLLARAIGLGDPAGIRTAEASRAQAQALLAEAVRTRDRLTLRSERGGAVLTRNLRDRIGQMLQAGDLFCEIGAVEQMLIKVPLSEQEVRHVRKGQPVALKAFARPGETVRGTIAAEPFPVTGRELAPGLSASRQGDVATQPDREGHEVPIERTYEVHVAVENADGFLRQGMSGRASIHAGHHLFGKLLLQSMLDLVSLDYRF